MWTKVPAFWNMHSSRGDRQQHFEQMETTVHQKETRAKKQLKEERRGLEVEKVQF